LKINYIGILGGILAFTSLLLPWWVMTMSAATLGVEMNMGITISPYQATSSAMGMSTSVAMNLWYGSAALALIVIGGVAAIVGSLIIGKTGKMILIVAGILSLFSIIIFAAGLQDELSNTLVLSNYPAVGLFSSGSWTYLGVIMDYSSYLTFGFWLALVAAILVFISFPKHPTATLTASSPTSPPPES
jgi:hypothetical protein